MTTTQMVEAVMNGTTTMDDVVRHNVEVMDRWFQSTPHNPEGCKNKNCVHGPRPMDVEHRNRLAREVGVTEWWPEV